MRISFNACRRAAAVARLLGILLAMATMAPPVCAADAPTADSWAPWTAERERLNKQLRGLVAAGNTAEAMGVAEQLIAADRRVLTLPAASDAEKRMRQDALREATETLQWLVDQNRGRVQWSAAAARQRDLADILTADLGSAHYRVSDARNEQAHLERLAGLNREEAGAVVTAEGNLAKVAELYKQGKYGEAIPLAQGSVTALEQWLGASSPQLATGLHWLGDLYEVQGDYARAEPFYLQDLEMRKKVLGENHPEYALSVNDLATLYRERGDFARAEPLYRQAMETRKKLLGENHSDYANSLVNLARLYMDQSDYVRAEPLYLQALEIRKKALGESHPDYATSLGDLAGLYKARGAYARAEPLYRQALKIYRQAYGENHPYCATGMNNLAALYENQGNYARAEPLFRQALEIRKKFLGENTPACAANLNNLAELYRLQGAYARAEPLYLQAREIWKKLVGENHPNYATSLDNLAALYMDQGNYARAEPLYREASQIRKKVLGERHLDYALSLHNLGWLYRAQGDFARAEPFYLQALEIKRKILGENDPSYAINLNNLAGLYHEKGDYRRAELLLNQSIEIQKKSVGENHPNYITSLNNLAKLYEDQGNRARAEQLFLQVLAIRKKVLGEQHPDYADSLESLAGLYKAQGDFARAGPLLRQALEINEKALGESHPRRATTLNNLAMLYAAQGDYARAEPLLQQALKIRKKVLGENHPDYAHSIDCLASLYMAQGDHARAEPLSLQALEIKKKALGENHPTYARTLDGVALLYMSQGDYARAEPLLQQALKIKTKVFGTNHPEYADSLHNLAALYRAQGDFARAEPYSRQALETERKTLGENHPDYANSLGGLALLYIAQGDYARAEPLVRQAVTIQCNQLEATAAIQSQRQQLAMLESVRPYLNGYLALAASQDQFSTPAYRLMLAWKGMVFRRERLTRVGEQTPELAALFRQLQAVAGQLAKLAWATPDPQQAARWRETIARLSEKKEQLEADLSARSAAFRRAKAPSTLEEIQAALPNDVVLVDFLEFWRAEWVAVPQCGGLGVRFDQTDEGAKITNVLAGGAAAGDGRLQPGDLILEITDRSGHWTATAGKTVPAVRGLMIGDAGSKVGLRVRRAQEKPRLELTLTRAAIPWQNKFEWKGEPENVAFVVRHDRPVVRINLGPAQPVSTAIDTWRQTCGASPQSAAAGKLLRETIWEPIAAQIHGAKIVLLSPDGALSKIPLGALPGKEAGKYLIEEYPLAVVPTAQMIPEIVAREAHKPLPENLLLVGNIDYDGLSGGALDAAGGAKQIGRNSAQGFVHFNRLPATQREVAMIAKLYHQDFGGSGLQTLEEDRATKAAFLAQAGRYRYLHLATHGFFIDGRQLAATLPVHRGADRLGEMPGGAQSAELHAGLLAGLALTGANQAGKAGGGNAAVNSSDNGILTAEEIGAQNLDGVQLVMLSACETGLGKAAGGEGLLGLQRSFQAAGARAVVASLWKVPDEETKALMGAFYTNLWQRKLSPLESLRQAQLTMLRNVDSQAGRLRAPDFSQTTALPTGGAAEKPAAARQARLSPVYWAAFVLSGDWR
jgi:CHAT domain-containing protein/tetratricopeptide (TPR) repeat protein